MTLLSTIHFLPIFIYCQLLKGGDESSLSPLQVWALDFALHWTSKQTNGQDQVNANKLRVFHTPLGEPELNQSYQLYKTFD